MIQLFISLYAQVNSHLDFVLNNHHLIPLIFILLASQLLFNETKQIYPVVVLLYILLDCLSQIKYH